MPRKTRYAGQPITTLAGRAEFLLREVYHGDQSRMAAATGVSQPQLSLVVGRKRSPGSKFFAGLAKIPGISIEWLSTGVGEPFSAPGLVALPTGGRSLPLASCPLPDSPQINANLLTGADLPVAEHHFKASRYFYSVQMADHVVRAGLDIRPGDLLLIESDPTFWRPNLGVLPGKLVVLKLRLRSGMVCVMAQAKPIAGRLEPSFEILGGPYGTGPESHDPELQLIERYGKGSRCIELSESWPEPPSPAGPTSAPAEKPGPTQPSPAEPTRPSVDDVAGLCLLLVRTDVG